MDSSPEAYSSGDRTLTDMDSPWASPPPASTPQVQAPTGARTWAIEALEIADHAGEQLASARNLKTSIKDSVAKDIKKLYNIVVQLDVDRRIQEPQSEEFLSRPKTPTKRKKLFTLEKEREKENEAARLMETLKSLEEHTRLIVENNAILKDIKEKISEAREETKEVLEKVTYASITAGQHQPIAQPRKSEVRQTLHSVAVTSTDEGETGDQVLDKLRKAIDAKEGWIEVQRVRKAKGAKVIVGLRTKEDREKLKSKINQDATNLNVEDIKNKDPLLVLKGVPNVHTDEEVLRALRNQNREVFDGLDEEESRAAIRFRKKTRNPRSCHIVITVSPTVWRRAIAKGVVRIDLRFINVEDQTPLVQCTRCLGFGHGKRFCTEPADLCSHCNGPHLRSECPDWSNAVPPKCRNCTKAGFTNIGHNAFDTSCPVRRKWDALARSTVAYS